MCWLSDFEPLIMFKLSLCFWKYGGFLQLDKANLQKKKEEEKVKLFFLKH